MFKNVVMFIAAILFVAPEELSYKGRSLRRLWWATVVAIMLGLSCLSGVVNANPAPVQSVVLETTVEAVVAPTSSVEEAAGARMMARRAAFDLLVRTACREVGAARGRIVKIYTESCDGVKYVITADVQVFSR